MTSNIQGRCKDCKWWYIASQDKSTMHSPCNHPKVAGHDGEDSDGAMDSYAEGGIDTGPEFGCIHWEAKA